MRRKTVAAASLLAMVSAFVVAAAPAPADDVQTDGHVHGDLEEFSGVHLHGSDAYTAQNVAAYGGTYFNESAGCGEPRGVMPPLTTTNSTSNRSIPSNHEVRGPWGDFFGRNYSDVAGSMVTWTIPMSGGKTTRVHERALPAFEKVAENLAAEAAKGRNYNVRIAGGWVWRRIGGLYRMSTHSFGTTIDINWDTNPYRSDNKLVTDMPDWFVDAWRDAGFCWGGDWQTVKDTMHFSWRGPLATDGYGKLPRPFAPDTTVSGYGRLEVALTSTFGSMKSGSLYTFDDGNADASPDLFRVEPWGDDDLLVSFARSSRDFTHCGVSTAVFEGGGKPGSKTLVADYEGTSRADVWSIDDSGANLEITVGRYADRYADPVQVNPGIAADSGATYLAGDHNRDGVPDLYVVHRSGTTTVDVYSGVNDFATKLYSASLPHGDTSDSSRWRFDLMDYDVDGVGDVAVIEVDGEVTLRVYSGASKLGTKLVTRATAAAALPNAVYEIEDWDGDGRGDILMLTPAGRIRVYLGGLQERSDTFWFQESNWSCKAAGSDVPWDFNGDRIADLPIGIPGEDLGGVVDAGVVQLLYGTKAGPTTSGSQRWHQDVGSIGSPVEAGDRFGSAMATGDFDGDGYGDLVVGVPDDGVGDVPHAGLINVIPGGRNGLTDVDSAMISRETDGVARPAIANARFGATLATGDFNNDGWDDLAVGAPGDRVKYRGAGSVTVLYGGKPGLTGAGSQVWTQNSRDIKNTAGRGDSFGASLAVGDFDGDGFDDLAIGSPLDKVDGQSRAGVVNVIYGGERGLERAGNQLFSQGNSAIPGEPDFRENFGRSLAAADFDSDGLDDLAIGVPGQRVSGSWSAGLVHVLRGTPSALSTSGVATWHADEVGVGGTADPGDKFGRTLSAGDFNRDGFADLAIGHPGESIPSASKTGAVTVLYGTGSGIRAVGSDLWLQGHSGLPAFAESDDQFGEQLRVADLDGDGYADLVIGMPSEDLDVVLAGVVMVIYGENGGLQSGGAQVWYEESPGLVGTAAAGDGLGTL